MLVGVHGGCIGAGVDLITACDIVYAAKNSFFSIKEIDIGIAADLGSLQRTPLMGNNWNLIKEYALTGANISPEEMKNIGLVGRVFDTKKDMESTKNIFS